MNPNPNIFCRSFNSNILGYTSSFHPAHRQCASRLRKTTNTLIDNDRHYSPCCPRVDTMSSIFCLRVHPEFLDHGTKCFGVVLHVLSPSGIMSTFFFMRDLSRPKGPFDDCIDFQKQSKDLVVFSPTAGQYVTIAWCVPWLLSLSHAEPVSTRPLWRGERITPTGIKAWLRNRGLHWSCFCALVSGSSHSTQIVQSAGDGKVYVFCSEYPSKCHFYCK